MAEGRRLSPRLLLALAALLLAAGDVVALFHSLTAHSRERDRQLDLARANLTLVRPRLAQLARDSGAAAACVEAVARGVGTEAEVVTPAGVRLASHPRPVQAAYRPIAGALDQAPDGVLALGPLGDPPRLLLYAVLDTPAGLAVLRVARPLDEGALADRRLSFAAHGMVLLLVLLALALVFAPGARGDAAGGALLAYEEAMGRLKVRGEASARLFAEERRRMEGELQELEAMARAGELTAGMVHEVRNALGTIVGHARLLESEAGSAASREAGSGIREECETLEAVVRRFMDYVRLERLELARLDLGALLRRVAAREGRARPRRIAFDLPERLEVEADEALLERAFENLVRNALEAAAAEVRIEAAPCEGGARVRIEDDGPGLALDPAEALRPFRSARPGGLGLGLPTAAKLVHLHGGRLSLGRVGARTRAEVVLPASAADVTDRTDPARRGSLGDAAKVESSH